MPKRKSPSAAASRGKTTPWDKRRQLYVTHIDFKQLINPQNEKDVCKGKKTAKKERG
jgi:hypothetical protein